MKNIAVLGSTGSIGVQTLDVIRNLDGYKVVSMACGSNIELFEKQIREFRPEIAAVYDEENAAELKAKISEASTKVYSGMGGLIEAAANSKADLVIVAVSGNIALIPTLEAIKNRIDVAIATKEVLVAAGELIIKAAKEYNINIIPIDSEHSAILQCIRGNPKHRIERIILTASGGPFLGRTLDELKDISVEQALNHPNWEMGKKISIDSATVMNKGLEVIEARWLFDVEPQKIKVLVHPQSIVHSMVEYIDGAVLAQLGCADMRIPIQYALTYPDRLECSAPKLDLVGGSLTFEEPDTSTFKLLDLAYKAIDTGGTVPAALNSANEEVVRAFLEKRIGFLDIQDIVKECVDNHKPIYEPKIEDILYVDTWAREFVKEQIKSRGNI